MTGGGMFDSQQPGRPQPREHRPTAASSDTWIPDLPLYHLDRPRLFDLLDTGVNGPLTLVSAPAGGGKTVLVSSWVSSGRPPYPVFWLSGGTDDVWARLAAVLADAGLVVPNAGNGRTPEDLLRMLDGIRVPVVVVLDDLPDVADPRLLAVLELVAERGRGQLRLVVACRVDPPLPLLRWRMRGVLTHLTANDLWFTLDEARALLSAHG